jgi:hypothetical protein
MGSRCSRRQALVGEEPLGQDYSHENKVINATKRAPGKRQDPQSSQARNTRFVGGVEEHNGCVEGGELKLRHAINSMSGIGWR